MRTEATPPRTNLLDEEKNRRGRTGSLLFVGAHNIAQQTWCPMYAVLKSRANEREFFGFYLDVRRHAAAVMKVENPTTLETLAGLSWKRVRNVLERPFRSKAAPTTTHWAEDLPPYVVCAIPDGFRPGVVTERKTSSSSRYVEEKFAQASLQADIYGLVMGAERKELEVVVGGEIIRRVSFVETDSARTAIASFAEIDAGKTPLWPEQSRCSRCEFRNDCPRWAEATRIES